MTAAVVAAGGGASGPAFLAWAGTKIATSMDGITWNTPVVVTTAGGYTYNVEAAACSPSRIVVGVQRTSDSWAFPCHSDDGGLTWTADGFNVTTLAAQVVGLAQASDTGEFMASLSESVYGNIVKSSDGITWADSSPPGDVGRGPVLRNPVLGKWFRYGGGSKIQSSTDGVTWTDVKTSAGTIASLALAPLLGGSNGMIAAGNTDGGLFTSIDGTTWVTRTVGISTNDINGLAWNGTTWVLGADSGNVRTSPDAATWTDRATAAGFAGANVDGVAYSAAAGKFCIVGALGKIATSPDGATWTPGATPFGAGVNILGVIALR